MTSFQPEEVTALAAVVVDLPILDMQVRLGHVAFTSQPPAGGDIAIAASIGLAVTWTGIDEGAGRYALSSRYSVGATRTVLEDQQTDSRGEGSDEEAWTCEVEIQGQWIFAGSVHLQADNLRAFAARVGIMSLHPYARAQIQRLVTEAGWPPYTLDVITSQDEIFADPDDQTRLELDGISLDITVSA